MEGNEFFFDVSSFFVLGTLERKRQTRQSSETVVKILYYYFVQEKLALLFFLRVKLLLCV